MDNPLQSYLTAAFGNSGMPSMFQNAFSGTQDQPSFFSGGSSGNGYAGDLAGLYGQYQGAQTANNVNNQVQGMNAQQQGAIQSQIAAMQAQAAKQRADAAAAYDAAKAQYGTQNTGLQGNIDTMTSNLNALNDPNSPYMQMARQAIERKDAAAGRRSQWGERETQLAGTLADYVGKYAPGLNNSITTARDEINKNNNSLASIYDSMNKSGALTDNNITNLINAINAASTNANTTGRNAATAATNNTSGLVNSGMGAASSLIKGLFGLGQGGGSGGLSDYYGNTASQQYGITGLGGQIGNNYGLDSSNYGPTWGAGSISSGLNSGVNPYGYTSMIGDPYNSGYSSGFNSDYGSSYYE